jgi:hypothetical protein
VLTGSIKGWRTDIAGGGRECRIDLDSIGAFCTLPAGIAPMTYRCTSGLPPKTRHFDLGFVTQGSNHYITMVLAILWVCVGNMHSIVMVGALRNKLDFRRSQQGVGVDIFSVLALRISTWVTYSPQDSVQRLLLCLRSRASD